MIRQLLLGSARRSRATLLCLGVALALLGAEAVCQVGFLLIRAHWRSDRFQHNFYFDGSESPVLAFGLKRNYAIDIDGRRLRTNAYGLRDDDDAPPPGARSIAVLGDSVVFGFNLDQADTITAHVQRLLDPDKRRVKVFNFGIPGYALREYPESLRHHARNCRVDAVVLILNPNDFTLRGTLYEGGDNGLNKMFSRPVLMSPYFASKMLYRMNKGADFPGLQWYEWIYRGTRDRNLPYLIELRDECRARGVTFKVVIMPSGRVWREGRYGLADEAAGIAAFLSAAEIPFAFPVDRFGGASDPNDSSGFYDHTDHFTSIGAAEMARVIVELLGPDALPPPSEAPSGP